MAAMGRNAACFIAFVLSCNPIVEIDSPFWPECGATHVARIFDLVCFVPCDISCDLHVRRRCCGSDSKLADRGGVSRTQFLDRFISNDRTLD